MDQVSLIRDKIDIAAFIGEFITLKKAGKNFKANCPFHSESTPSFMVSPERQMWHCFGCGKGGDIYSFVMEYERAEFPEALRMLAKRAGIELTSQKFDTGTSSKKEKIYQINNLAKEFYHYLLMKHPVGKNALTYLQNRGITQKMIDTFHLGFAPAQGTRLVNYLIEKKNYTKEDLIEAGLAVQTSNRLIDFFRGRLMFTLIDHRDNVVGFSGRILDANPDISKYVNTRETLAYHKGEHVFGINVTKDAIRRENRAIIVEGEFDVISSFQHGVSNVVAVKGTALTENQVNLLGRYAQKITFCFDGDKAGYDAMKRSLPLVEKKGLTPTVIAIPGGKDPDEALQKDPGGFKKAVHNEISIYDYLFERTFADNDLRTAEGKKQSADILLPVIADIKNEIIKEHYIRKISQDLATSPESINKELQRLGGRTVVQVPKSLPKQKQSKEELTEEYLLALILQSEHPKKFFDKAIGIISDSMSKERAYHKIMDQLFRHFEHVDTFDGKKFSENLPKELLDSYDKCFLRPVPIFNDQEKLLAEVEKKSHELRDLYRKQQRKELVEQIQQKEQEGKEDEANELRKRYSSLVQ